MGALPVPSLFRMGPMPRLVQVGSMPWKERLLSLLSGHS